MSLCSSLGDSDFNCFLIKANAPWNFVLTPLSPLFSLSQPTENKPGYKTDNIPNVKKKKKIIDADAI